jgi:hypothetical protein
MSTTITSLLLLGCVNTQVLDHDTQKVIYDVRCENNVTVVYRHDNQEKLYTIKDEGKDRVLREYKTGKVLSKNKR